MFEHDITAQGMVILWNDLMKNIPELMFQIVKLNFGGEILKDKERILKNLNKIPG